MLKRKKYLWGIAILALAAAAMLINVEENLDEEFSAIAEHTESTPSSAKVSYLDLPLTEEDKANIYRLLEPLANWSLLSLGFNRKDIEQRGYATKDIPILRYLGYVRMHPELSGFIRKIRSRSKIWKPFEKGFVKGLTNSYARGEIQPYLVSFAADTQLDYDQLNDLAVSSDWAGFLHVVLFSK